MILALPPRAFNDNEAKQFWVCFRCQQGAFLLEWEHGKTRITCALCHVDVTPHVMPELGHAAS